jgi:glucosamine--fructose-6-phosphate aminotransferase (isomerizing)
VLGRSTLVIAISQSGETADTLEAVRHARAQRARVLAVTNTIGSTISRESDAALYTRGGPEVAVASTKAVMTQITAMYLVGLYLAQLRGTRDADEVRSHLRDLQEVPDLLEEVLSRMEPVRALAREIADAPRVLFIGRHVGYPIALEGALKLKELAYVSAEGSPPARSSTARSPWWRRARRSSCSPPATRSPPSWPTTCRRCAPAAPARSSSRPTATRASPATPTT